ncbi:hypothetical protein FIBSPDRAFT_856792 [Athelia psychrophila]|uniref:Uncharacterized protein n=1 Tax=Athelia psychrophila TaxID=1759441 RepID=A0A166N360_9AGAM|nr:hypothetical protein FIBSPDRAFT_856792 [Fibularhizoctonia sp. CBS 109695]
MEPTEGPDGITDVAQKALQANKVHQYALKVYTERLEAELRTIDKLLVCFRTADVEHEDDEPELDAGGYVTVPNSERAAFPISANEFLSADSPFHDDAEKRNRYINHTASHPMKPKELEVLAEAVRTENHRKRALEAQTGGLLTFAPRDDKDFFEWNTEGIDWGRVAEKVSTVANQPRTAQDCAILWLGDRHPKFVHTVWAPAEIAQLQALVKSAPKDPVNWVEIAESLGTNRTPLDCMRHGLQRKSHNWTPASDKALLNAIHIYGIDNWILVASRVSEDAEPRQCRNRYERTLHPSIQRGAWSAEEDERLRLAVKAYGMASWADVAEVVLGRNNEQCRDRWQDNLNPSLTKGKWTPEEDELLKEAVKTLGTSSWKAVSEHIGNGRTDNTCRAHYNVLAKQKNPTKNSATSESSGSTEGPPGPVPSKAAPKRRRSRQAPATEPVPEDDRQQESEPAIDRPRPRPRPRPTQTLKDTVVPEDTAEAGEAAVEGAERLPASAKGAGKSKAAKTPRKRKTRGEETSEIAAPPPKKRRGGKVAPTSGKPVVGENAREGVDAMNTEDEVLPSTSKKGSRPSRRSAPQALAPNDAGAEASSAMDEAEQLAASPTRPAASSTRPVAAPTRRQPARNASQKKS